MPTELTQLIENMTPEEQVEVAGFAAFVMARRKWLKPRLLTDDVSTQELMQLVTEAGSFDWLDTAKEDVYSINDGEAVQWPDA